MKEVEDTVLVIYMFMNGAWMPLFYAMYPNLSRSLILGTQEIFFLNCTVDNKVFELRFPKNSRKNVL